MLHRLAACAHGVRILVEPFLHGLDNPLVLPPRDATLFSRRALSFDWAGMARIGPITAKFLAVFLSRKTVREFLTRRAHIDVLLRLIDKILLAEPARRLGAGCHRFRQRHGDAGVVTGGFRTPARRPSCVLRAQWWGRHPKPVTHKPPSHKRTCVKLRHLPDLAKVSAAWKAIIVPGGRDGRG